MGGTLAQHIYTNKHELELIILESLAVLLIRTFNPTLYHLL
jgi:hypothetical protein